MVAREIKGKLKEVLRKNNLTALFYKADPDYGLGVAKGLGLDEKEVERLARMSQEELAETTAKVAYAMAK